MEEEWGLYFLKVKGMSFTKKVSLYIPVIVAVILAFSVWMSSGGYTKNLFVESLWSYLGHVVIGAGLMTILGLLWSRDINKKGGI